VFRILLMRALQRLLIIAKGDGVMFFSFFNEMTLKLTTSMGISADAALKVIDLIQAGASTWLIITTIVTSGGIIGVSMLVVRQLLVSKLKQLGRAAFVAW